MSPPFRIEWFEDARNDVRRLDRDPAMQIIDGILRYAETGSGDVRRLAADLGGYYRLRIRHYRVLFELDGERMRIHGVRHRSKAYR